jgi:hypothetical protein
LPSLRPPSASGGISETPAQLFCVPTRLILVRFLKRASIFHGLALLARLPVYGYDNVGRFGHAARSSPALAEVAVRPRLVIVDDHPCKAAVGLRSFHDYRNKVSPDRTATEAIATLEPLSTGKELAMAYGNLSQLHMLAEEPQAAIEWGRRALNLAEAQQETEIVIHALTNTGSAESFKAEAGEREMLERALAPRARAGIARSRCPL